MKKKGRDPYSPFLFDFLVMIYGDQEGTPGSDIINLANGFRDWHLISHERSEEGDDAVFLLHVSAQVWR